TVKYGSKEKFERTVGTYISSVGVELELGNFKFAKAFKQMKATFEAMKQVKEYQAVGGPNSNTYIRALLKVVGFPEVTSPIITDSSGWDYHGLFRYGGPKYNLIGVPI